MATLTMTFCFWDDLSLELPLLLEMARSCGAAHGCFYHSTNSLDGATQGFPARYRPATGAVSILQPLLIEAQPGHTLSSWILRLVSVSMS